MPETPTPSPALDVAALPAQAASGPSSPPPDGPSTWSELGFRSASSFLDLLRGASRHCRRLVDCEVARIWLVRRAGSKLVARDFPDGVDAPPVVHRLGRGEGLAGWVLAHRRPIRLRHGDGLPAPLVGTLAQRSALVLPLERRGEVFAVIECLDHRGDGGFDDAAQERLTVAAEHIAFALDNVLLVEETERRALEKDMLFEAAKTLAAPLELDEVIEAMMRSLGQVVAYDAAAVYLLNKATLALEVVHAVGYPAGSDEAFSSRVGVGIIGWVATTGEPVIVPDVRRDTRYVAARPETRSELAVPLIVEGRTIGVFNLESDYDDAYHQGHLELVTAFASQAAVAVERARLTRELVERQHIERELSIAREIQASFLPDRAPVVAGFDLAGRALPHRRVGGDYYDFISISDSRLGLAIADVSGKGIPAALIMAGFRASLLAEIRNEFAIRAVMRKVNSLLYESTDRSKFVTAFYGVLDFKNRVLIFTNAGHNPPIIARGDEVLALLEGGVALGVLPDAHYEEKPIALRPDDVLVLYTDGVSEAESPAGELFGQQRLERLVVTLRQRTAQEILDAIIEAVLEWCGEPGQTDDLTLMVVKVLPESA
jgi:serine phosphatase RsbU (regulator of sigma subunit)